MPLSHDILQGSIVWLPPIMEYKQRLADQLMLSQETVQDAFDQQTCLPARHAVYNHPVIIVSRSTNDPYKAQVCIITTFGGKSIQRAFRRQKAKQLIEQYLLMDSKQSTISLDLHDKRCELLTFENGYKMQRQCYVDCKNVFTIDWRATWSYDKKKSTKLSNQSIRWLLQQVNLHSGFTPDSRQFKQNLGCGKHQVSTSCKSYGTLACPTSPQRLQCYAKAFEKEDLHGERTYIPLSGIFLVIVFLVLFATVVWGSMI